MNRILFTIFFFCVISNQLFAQDDNLDSIHYSKDTIFILLSEKIVAKNNGKKTINPDKNYPEDMSRRYHLEGPDSFNNIYYTDPSMCYSWYFSELKSKFERRNYFLSDDLSKKSIADLLELLDNRVIMMVDTSFSTKENHFVVRVIRYAGEN